MTIKREQMNKIINKAKTKEDGVYSLGGVPYRVKDNGVTHIGGHKEVFACCGMFVTSLGTTDDVKKTLKAIKD